MIPVILKIVAVVTLNISLHCFFNIPENYIVFVFVLTVYFIQQITGKYSWSKRLNDSVHVFCILICLFSIRALIESDFDVVIFLCFIVLNALLLLLSGKYKYYK